MAERSLIKQILTNFLNSLIRIKKYSPQFKGKDHFGTEYYESQRGLESLKRPSRWFVPPKSQDFQQERPTEWEAWLRYKRKEPPTEEEIELNYRIMKDRIEKARNLTEPKSVKADISQVPNANKFPTYEEYKLDPSISQKKNQQ